MKSRITTLFMAFCLTLTLAGVGFSQDAGAAKKKIAVQTAKLVAAKAATQKTCPTCGMKLGDKVETVDVAGKRIYTCSAGCAEKVKADPAKAIAALASKGETTETHLVICSKCGHLKGSKACCDPNGVKCEKCGLAKDSPFCCTPWAKYLSLNYTQDAAVGDLFTLCEKCGEIKGSKDCCKRGCETCQKCGHHKGAPGCCYKAEFIALAPVVE